MKIVYGVQGTGNGHLSRSLRVIEALVERGHTVDMVMSAQWGTMPTAYPVFKLFKGFTFKHTKDGSINKLGTAINFDFWQFFKDSRFDLSTYDKIITDFEPIVAWAALRQKREVYGISNQYSFLSNKTPRPAKKDWMAELAFKNFTPVAHPIGLHFEQYDDFIYKPILRQSIYNLTLSDAGHFTVYLPDIELPLILQELFKHPAVPFHLFSNKIKQDTQQGNVCLRPPDPAHFSKSFASCHGVITRCGFQTTAEALYTGKKLLAMPQRGQYEQQCNAISLARLGATIGNLQDLGSYLQAPEVKPQPWADPVNAILARVLG